MGPTAKKEQFQPKEIRTPRMLHVHHHNEKHARLILLQRFKAVLFSILAAAVFCDRDNSFLILLTISSKFGGMLVPRKSRPELSAGVLDLAKECPVQKDQYRGDRERYSVPKHCSPDKVFRGWARRPWEPIRTHGPAPHRNLPTARELATGRVYIKRNVAAS